ncbi:MAG: TIR domain-containing protein [Candidatus Lokiarchaeota archaeon]|nr:TIR domain-containing protein [Candidatus Lokiarchaeota archaeon]
MRYLEKDQQEFLEGLEKQIGRKFPRIKKIHDTAFGVKIEDNNIVGLGLYNYNLKVLPDTIRNLTSLRTIVLSNNELTLLPDTICTLKSLKKIFLHKNLLKKLPISFGDLSSLQILQISNNLLNKLPESFSDLKSLKKLDIFKNNLERLPEKIGQLESLEELNLFQNNLSILPESIGSLKHLKELNLDLNELEILPESIGNLESLHVLKLQRNKLFTLPESFKHLISLNTLDLRKNNFKSIPGIIWPLKNLKEIYLNGNPLDNDSIDILERDQSAILEYCRKKANITVFISHAWDDQELYRIIDLSVYLENREEIYEVFVCEEDLIGDIQEFMDEKVPRSQLLIFIGTNNSIKSSACQHEIALAISNDIEIIPIKGLDLTWTDLNQIDLTDENLGYFDLGNKKGIEFSSNNFESFCENLYEYIKKYKREINLYEKDIAKIDKLKLDMIDIFTKFTDTDDFTKTIKNNLVDINLILEKLKKDKISIPDFFLNYFNIVKK